jgi:hypothetical protein
MAGHLSAQFAARANTHLLSATWAAPEGDGKRRAVTTEQVSRVGRMSSKLPLRFRRRGAELSLRRFGAASGHGSGFVVTGGRLLR